MRAGAWAFTVLVGAWTAPAIAQPAPPVAETAQARGAPPVCAEAAQALHAYSVHLETEAPGSPQRDPATLLAAIAPACRQAVLDGHWPALASMLLPLAEKNDELKAATCELAPPEAFPSIVEWTRIAVGSGQRWAYDAACAEALLRHRRADFDRIVEPGLAKPQVTMLLAQRLAGRLPSEERGVLWPALETATRTQVSGRDDLFRLVCGVGSVPTPPVCRAPTSLELDWAHAARRRKAAPTLALHFCLALLYGITCTLLWRRSRADGLLVTLGVAGSSGTAVALAWFCLADPGHGGGETSGLGGLLALFATPVAALAGAVVGWLALRVAKLPALAWCLAQDALYAIVVGLLVWHANGG